MIDLVIQNSLLVTPQGTVRAAVACSNGKIVTIGNEATMPPASCTIDAKGNYVIPGVVDPHLHAGSLRPFGEDFKDVSRASLAGGVTTINILARSTRMTNTHKAISSPEDAVSYHAVFDEANALAQQNSVNDYTFSFTIMTHQHAHEIPQYSERYGIRTFKFYMQDRPLGEFENRVGRPVPFDDGLMYLGFTQIARTKTSSCAFLHCENNELSRVLKEMLIKEGRKDVAAWEESRPGIGEADCIRRASYFSRITGCPIYIVHLSSEEGLKEVLRAKVEGTRITAETLPKQLTLTKNHKAGSLLKAMPPIRDERHIESLWKGISDGAVDCIGSDFVTTLPEDNGPAVDNIWKAPVRAGNSETLLPVMLSEGVCKGRITIERLVSICCENPAKVLGIFPRKGAIAVGSDADLVIVDMKKKVRFTREMLHSSNADVEAIGYEGREFEAWPIFTIARGEVVVEQGEVLAKSGRGRYLYQKA